MSSPQQAIVAACTLGCKTNHAETRAILADFSRSGYGIADFSEQADVYLINTCSVTGEAGRKSGQMIRQARQRNREAVVIALGCHIELGADLDEADILIGNQGKNRVPEILQAWQSGSGGQLDLRQAGPERLAEPVLNRIPAPDFEEFRYSGLITETRAEIKIQDGCNNFCSYCTIPYARGRVRSRDEEHILREARDLAGQGMKELVLTGIHICSYGRDMGRDSMALIELLQRLCEVDGVMRIRLGSLEPGSISEGFAEGLKALPKVCPHYHLSLQSGSDTTLKRMNRHYDTKGYRLAVSRLREARPDANFTTDIITGFPGETEAEHQESLAFCREIGFGRMHIFRYSERPGTRAARLPGKVNGRTAGSRAGAFRKLAFELWQEHAAGRCGAKAVMLLEQLDESGQWQGYDAHYEPLLLSDPDRRYGAGDLLPVVLCGTEGEAIRAEAV